MDFEGKLDLVRDNTAELITEEEIKALLQTKDKPVVYCGYEPSGPVHLGHLVTITKLIQLQKAGFTAAKLSGGISSWRGDNLPVVK